jgi:putative polyketide hydroxylase
MNERLDSTVDSEAPVLFAGGGLVGLSTAMFLAQHGIASLAVERLRGGSPVPRAAFFHMRTLEMFRSAGIEDAVRKQSLKEFEPEGAVVLMDSLAGKQIAGFIPSLNEGVDALSPCRRLFVTQPGLEPILRARAEEAGARVLEGTEIVGVVRSTWWALTARTARSANWPGSSSTVAVSSPTALPSTSTLHWRSCWLART